MDSFYKNGILTTRARNLYVYELSRDNIIQTYSEYSKVRSDHVLKNLGVTSDDIATKGKVVIPGYYTVVGVRLRSGIITSEFRYDRGTRITQKTGNKEQEI